MINPMPEHPKTTVDLITLIAAAVAEISKQPKVEGPRNYMPVLQFVTSNHPLAVQIKAAISSDDSFGHLRDGWMVALSSGGVIQDHVLPFKLIEKAIEGADVAAAIERFRHFASAPQSAIDLYALIVGASVADEVEVSASAWVIPWAKVPAGRQKELFEPKDAWDFDRFNTRFAHPTAAIRITLPSRQVFFGSSDEATKAVGASIFTEEAPVLKVQEIVRCLTVAAAGPVAIVGSWSEYTDELARSFAPLSTSHTPAFSEFSLLSASINPVVMDGAILTALANDFAAQPEKGKAALGVIMTASGKAFAGMLRSTRQSTWVSLRYSEDRVSQVLKELVHDGWLTMERDEADKRMRKVHASDQLRRLFGEYKRFLLEMLSDLNVQSTSDEPTDEVVSRDIR